MAIDTFRYVIKEDGEKLTYPNIQNGDGVSDTVKASLKRGVAVSNQVFIGSPSENDIDMVRGSDAIIGPNDHTMSKGKGAKICVKGGFTNVHFVGNFGTAELGQYSIYDQWFALPKTSGVTFDYYAEGTCYLWNCEVPSFVPPLVNIVHVHEKLPKFLSPLVVKSYFLLRSIQQYITGK